jgi:hypothetical protein
VSPAGDGSYLVGRPGAASYQVSCLMNTTTLSQLWAQESFFFFVFLASFMSAHPRRARAQSPTRSLAHLPSLNEEGREIHRAAQLPKVIRSSDILERAGSSTHELEVSSFSNRLRAQHPRSASWCGLVLVKDPLWTREGGAMNECASSSRGIACNSLGREITVTRQ